MFFEKLCLQFLKILKITFLGVLNKIYILLNEFLDGISSKASSVFVTTFLETG